MSWAQKRVSALGGSTVALSGVVTGTTTGATSMSLNGPQMPEWDSLAADVSATVATSLLVVVLVWQVSTDNATWRTIYDASQTAYAQVAATGTGVAVTTNWKAAAPKGIGSYPYARVAVVSTGATGGASDQVVVTYTYLKRLASEN